MTADGIALLARLAGLQDRLLDQARQAPPMSDLRRHLSAMAQSVGGLWPHTFNPLPDVLASEALLPQLEALLAYDAARGSFAADLDGFRAGLARLTARAAA